MANRREKVEAVTDFIFLGYNITVGDNCCHEIKRPLLLGRKAMTNLDSILKSRSITLLTKICILKAMFLFFSFFFPSSHVWNESWSIKKSAKELMVLNCGAGKDS